MTDPVRPISDEERAWTIQHAASGDSLGERTRRNIVALDARLTVAEAQLAIESKRVENVSALFVAVARALGCNTRGAVDGNAHVIKRAEFLSEQFTADRYTATLEAERECAELHAKLAKAETERDEWKRRCEATGEQRDVYRAERDAWRNRCEYGRELDRETRNDACEAIAAWRKRAEAAAVKLAEFQEASRLKAGWLMEARARAHAVTEAMVDAADDAWWRAFQATNNSQSWGAYSVRITFMRAALTAALRRADTP